MQFQHWSREANYEIHRFSLFSQGQLDDTAWKLNTRPRKALAWKTPAKLFLPEGAFDFVEHWHAEGKVALLS